MDLGRLAWLAGGYPESVAGNSICQQCSSDVAVEHAARAIMWAKVMSTLPAALKICIEYHGNGCSLSQKSSGRKIQSYGPPDGLYCGKVASMWKVPVEDMLQMAYWSNKNAAAFGDAGTKNEIVPIEGHDEAGNPFIVDRDQWMR